MSTAALYHFFVWILKMPMQMWESRLYYLSGQRDFNRHRYQLCQEAAIEGHHEHHWVIVWKNKCDLQMRCETCVTVHLLQVRSTSVQTSSL